MVCARFPIVSKKAPQRNCKQRAQLYQQDTKEYLNQRGTYIGVFRESKKGVKGGGEEGRGGGRVNRA